MILARLENQVWANMEPRPGLQIPELFSEMRRTTSRKKIWNGAQKKVLESGGLVGDDLAVL